MKRQYENMNNAQKVNEFLGIGKRDRSDKINNNNPKYKKIVKGKLYDNCLDEIKKIINQHQPINNEMTPFYYIVSNIIKYDNKKKNYLQFIQEMKLKVTKKKIYILRTSNDSKGKYLTEVGAGIRFGKLIKQNKEKCFVLSAYNGVKYISLDLQKTLSNLKELYNTSPIGNKNAEPQKIPKNSKIIIDEDDDGTTKQDLPKYSKNIIPEDEKIIDHLPIGRNKAPKKIKETDSFNMEGHDDLFGTINDESIQFFSDNKIYNNIIINNNDISDDIGLDFRPQSEIGSNMDSRNDFDLENNDAKNNSFTNRAIDKFSFKMLFPNDKAGNIISDEKNNTIEIFSFNFIQPDCNLNDTNLNKDDKEYEETKKYMADISKKLNSYR